MDIDGAPWFVAADVCRCLALPNLERGVFQHLVRLAADEKRKATHSSSMGMRGSAPTLISESGMYRLVMRSDKPEARAFQDWVTRDVLPAIRKEGVYVRGESRSRAGIIMECLAEAGR